jgi:hypothetical protein
MVSEVRPASDDEGVTFLPGLLIVESFEVMTTLVQRRDEPDEEPELGVLVKMVGHVNGTTDRVVHNAALTPKGAAELMRTITASYAHATKRSRDSFGRPVGPTS